MYKIDISERTLHFKQPAGVITSPSPRQNIRTSGAWANVPPCPT